MHIRQAEIEDAEELARLLNSIVAEGGKTAIDSPLTGREFAEWFITGSHCISCLLAGTDDAILGFQALERFHDDLPQGMADIATFVTGRARGSGIGRILSDATSALATEAGVQRLRAVIQRTNKGAIGFYRAVGFRDDAANMRGNSVVLIRHTARAVMGEDFDPVAHNRFAWDRLVDSESEWSRPVSPEEISRAREGDWSVILIGHEPTPHEWFPADLSGVRVLCLASGGGQQGPVLAAAGAIVTVFDNSPRQLARDDEVAEREGLKMRTILGDMRDLDAFDDGAFDLIVNPVSNVFCPDLAPIWAETFRVLRSGGLLLAGFMNPDVYIFDEMALDQKELVVRHRLPFSSLDLSESDRMSAYGDGPIEYSHSLTEQIGGQLAAGFVLTNLVEAPHHADITAQHLPAYFATRAIKP